MIMWKCLSVIAPRGRRTFHVNIGENQDGFVLLSSVYHRRISVFT